MFKSKEEYFVAIDQAIDALRKNDFHDEAEELYIAKNCHFMPSELFWAIEDALKNAVGNVHKSKELHEELKNLLAVTTQILKRN